MKEFRLALICCLLLKAPGVFAQAPAAKLQLIDLTQPAQTRHTGTLAASKGSFLVNVRFQGRDSVQQMPVRIILPANYTASEEYPAILYLHGESSHTKWTDPEVGSDEGDLFTEYFHKQGFIIIKPYADRPGKFTWNPNPYVDKTNPILTNTSRWICRMHSRTCWQRPEIHTQIQSNGRAMIRVGMAVLAG